MFGLGVILVLVGFALVIPRGGISGSAAVRNVDMGLQGVHRTPGYQDAPDRRLSRHHAAARVLIGFALMGLGVLCFVVAAN